MSKPSIGIGMEVFFKSHVYGAPFAPFYDKYAGHKFRVVRFGDGARGEDPSAVELKCVTGSINVDGQIDTRDLKRA